jgi:hypothetical protein
MAVREYETWLLLSYPEVTQMEAGIADPERARDAKGRLRRLVPGYKPTTHQLAITRTLDIDAVWSKSDSFDKLVRSLAGVVGVTPPPRPDRQSG